MTAIFIIVHQTCGAGINSGSVMCSPSCPQFGKTALDLAVDAENETCVWLLKQATVGVKNGTGRIMMRTLRHSSSENKSFDTPPPCLPVLSNSCSAYVLL